MVSALLGIEPNTSDITRPDNTHCSTMPVAVISYGMVQIIEEIIDTIGFSQHDMQFYPNNGDGEGSYRECEVSPIQILYPQLQVRKDECSNIYILYPFRSQLLS